MTVWSPNVVLTNTDYAGPKSINQICTGLIYISLVKWMDAWRYLWIGPHLLVPQMGL